MHFNILYIFVILVIFVILIIGIIFFLRGKVKKNNSINTNLQSDFERGNEYITIKGIAEYTKSGYRIDGCILEYSEIQKYDASHTGEKYFDKDLNNKNLEVIGKIKEVKTECSPNSQGIVSQCIEGPYKAIYDIQSIKILE